jgi:hypothetical protein
MLKIEVESNHFDEKLLCHCCGQVFCPREVTAKAYRESGEYLMDVCPQCLAGGTEGISRRMRQRADYFRNLAIELERLAREDIEAPSIDQFNIMNQLAKALQ